MKDILQNNSDLDPLLPQGQLTQLFLAYNQHLDEKSRELNLISLTRQPYIIHPSMNRFNSLQTTSQFVGDLDQDKLLIHTTSQFLDQSNEVVQLPASITFAKDSKGSHLIFSLRIKEDSLKPRGEFVGNGTKRLVTPNSEIETVTFEPFGGIRPQWNAWGPEGSELITDQRIQDSLSRQFLSWCHIQSLPGIMKSVNDQSTFEPAMLDEVVFFIDNNGNGQAQNDVLYPFTFSKN